MFRSLRASGLLGMALALGVASTAAQAHTSSLTFDRVVELSPGRTLLTVSGEITCDPDDALVIEITVRQGNGQNRKFASGFLQDVCLGTPQSWQVLAFSDFGEFHPGKAAVRAIAGTLAPDHFSQTFLDAHLHLA